MKTSRSPEILILGCGFLGRVLAAQWAAEGTTVWASTRSPQRADAFRALGWRPIVCDVLDPASLRALPDVPLIVYGVGLDRSSGATQRQVYVEGAGNVVSELLRPDRPPPPRLIYISSTGVYAQRDGVFVDESSPAEPEEESGRVILAAEQLLRQRLPDSLILRCAGLYGPGRLLRAASLRAGEPVPGDPDKWLNLIHVADAATAVRAAARHGRPGRILNLCDDHPVRRRDFFTFLAQALGAPVPRFEPASPGPDPDRADRRILNRRLHDELGVTLQYPGYRKGIPASLS